MGRYVEIRYTDSIERVPLHDVSELDGILRARGSFVDYSIRSSVCFGLVNKRKKGVFYVPAPLPRRDDG